MVSIRRVHPGVYIKETLDAMEMTAKEFSFRTGISERTLSAIINGDGDITFDVAYKLSSYFDNSVSYWVNLQTQYKVFLQEKKEEELINQEWSLIKSIKQYLLNEKYIKTSDGKKDIVSKCRELAGVNSLLSLNQKDLFACLKEQQIKANLNYFFQNFYLALALKEARKKKNNSFNKEILLNLIDEIRRMTIQDPKVFYPRLQQIFAESGVSFVLLPYLPKSNIYGATKWFGKDSVMLAISNRGESADLFWFTLFHEISHVLMGHKRETLLNIEGIEDKEADAMASEILIPKKEWDIFIKDKNFNKLAIKKFANKIGIHPCIVLGRLHKENKIPYGVFDKTFHVKYQICRT